MLAACQIWTTRYVIDPDGTAYVDVARAWLQGDWIHALNSYWSPLYIWLFTLAFGVFSPSAHWQIPLIHVVALVGFLGAFAAWEWLNSEWELWQGVSAHPVLSDVAGYCVFTWAGLSLTGLGWFNSADILVMALLLAATTILIRVRREAAQKKDFLLLGVALGTGFLGKNSFRGRHSCFPRGNCDTPSLVHGPPNLDYGSSSICPCCTLCRRNFDGSWTFHHWR